MLPITDEYVKFILEQNKHLMEQNDRLLEQNQQLNEQIAKLNITVDQLNETVDINVDVQIIAHEALSVECPIRNATFKGAFPKEISAPVQYGDNLAALVVALNTVGALSVSRTNEILSGVFNVPIATGTISSMVTRCSDLVTPTVRGEKSARCMKEYFKWRMLRIRCLNHRQINGDDERKARSGR